MKKRLTVLFLIVVLALALCACSDNKKKPSDTTNNNTGSVTESQTDGATSECPETDDFDEAQEEKDIKYFKKKAAKFDSADFGKIVEFGSPYKKPQVCPVKGEHPRVMVNSHNIDKLRSELKSEENKVAYSQYIDLAGKDAISGKYPKEKIESTSTNADRNITSMIEAKAYYYLMTGRKSVGYQAIFNLKNALLTIDATGVADEYREYGLLMYVSACVYDWCYDILTDLDKEQIAGGVCNMLGKKFEIGWPPEKKGNISHHNLECQLLRSYLSFAIAVYDEYPFVYDYVAGRLFEEMVPAQNFMLQSGKHWEGSGYGPSRSYYLMWAQILFSAMTKGEDHLFDDESLHNTTKTFLHFLYPGELKGHPAFEIGDQCNQYLTDFYLLEFFAGNHFKDPVLKGFSQNEYFNNEDNFMPGYYSFAWVTPTTYLIINDTEVKSSEWRKELPLVQTAEFPGTAVFARGSWTDPNAPAVYMNMNEYYSSSHSHMETGSFQIYYKGILASDSGGYYDGYGSRHHYGYTVQTISSNSLLIYNNDAQKSLSRSTHPYSGGQSLVSDRSRFRCGYTLDDAKNSKSMNQCTILGKRFEADKNSYKYSYLAGDMTKAYDEKTVDEVTRHMLSVMTNDNDCPMVFVTFDRVTAKEAKYKKTVLLHSKQKPEYKDGYVIIKNTLKGNSGKLIAQSLITDMNVEILGGDGKEYTVNGKPIVPNGYTREKTEYRIDMSPKTAQKTDYMMTCMYVTDAKNEATPVKAQDISTDELAGALIFNRAMLFAKEKGRLAGKYEFTTSGDEQIDYYVAGVSAGSWEVTVNGNKSEVSVKEGEGLLRFTGGSGNISITFKG